MKIKILVVLFLLPFALQAQMFNKKQNTKNRNENTIVQVNSYSKEISLACDAGYKQFKINLVKLASWELNQYVRVLKEIKEETKDFSPKKRTELKNQKLIELALLLSDKEMDLDFQHYELIDYLNDINAKWAITHQFEPEIRVEGRLQDKMLEIALYQIEEQSFEDNVKKYMLNGTDVADLAIGFTTGGVGGAAATAASLTGGAAITAGIVIGTGVCMLVSTTVEKGIDLLLPDLEKVLKMRNIDFTDGLMVDEYLDFKEQIQFNTQTLKK